MGLERAQAQEYSYLETDYERDKSDRKLQTDNVFLLERDAIFWLSCKQHFMSTSTTETEYIVMFI